MWACLGRATLTDGSGARHIIDNDIDGVPVTPTSCVTSSTFFSPRGMHDKDKFFWTLRALTCIVLFLLNTDGNLSFPSSKQKTNNVMVNSTQNHSRYLQ